MTQDPLDTRVSNGQFISPDGLARTVLTIHEHRIVDDDSSPVWRNVNASGHIVLPGLIQAVPAVDASVLEKVRGGTTTGIFSNGRIEGAYLDVLPQVPDSVSVVEVSENSELTDRDWNRLLSEPGLHFQAAPESAFAVIHFLYHEGHRKRGMSLERIVELTSGNIANAAGLFPTKGDFQNGADGDLFVFDPDGNDPYSDLPWPGRVIFSLQRGSILLFNGQIHTNPGDGQLLRQR